MTNIIFQVPFWFEPLNTKRQLLFRVRLIADLAVPLKVSSGYRRIVRRVWMNRGKSSLFVSSTRRNASLSQSSSLSIPVPFMSGLKNSPFGKRLRASHREPASSSSTSTIAAALHDDPPNPSTNTTPNRPFNPIFGISSTSSLSLDSSSTIADNAGTGSESPSKNLRGSPKRQRFVGGMSMGGMGIGREYGDRFVPSKDSGDLRTSYHLMEEGGGGPSTPSKSRIIPSESDALKGQPSPFLVFLIDRADEICRTS